MNIADTEETPQSRQRKKVAKEDSDRKAMANKLKEEWFEIHGVKVLKCTRTGTGNVHRIYQCNNDKKNKEFVDGLKKDGLIRI